MKTWNERLKEALDESEEYQGNVNRFAGDIGVAAPSVAAWVAAGNIRPAKDIRAVYLVKACCRLRVRPEWILFGSLPKNSIGMGVNPDANVTDPNSDQVISGLIKRLQAVQHEVQEILSIVQGLPIESDAPEASHDMSISSVRRAVDAQRELVGSVRQEGQEYGHGRSREHKRSGKT
ncbi:hypothetical protein [Paraburkholderia sacchari]|uniref:hypothetical protein n=1 Tax=Paraburkholderia sacchari TaxID=159450 RepID=UPI003D95E975